MDIIAVTNIGIVVLELLLVGLMLRETWRLGRARPPVIWGLVAFFTIDGMVALNRSELFWARSERLANATALDLLALFVLVFVVVQARGIARTAAATLDLARFRAQEYDRARRDYTQVVRHRMMNPLTVIDGAARTLQAGESLDAATRDSLLQAIRESAQVLKDTTLEPERRDELERELQAVPRERDGQRDA